MRADRFPRAASGSPRFDRRVAETAFDAVIPGGRLLLFGVCPPGEKKAHEAFRIYNSEIDVIDAMAVFDSYEPALAAMAAGAIDARRRPPIPSRSRDPRGTGSSSSWSVDERPDRFPRTEHQRLVPRPAPGASPLKE